MVTADELRKPPQRYYDDVTVGQQMPPLVLGPMTPTHVFRWSAAIENWHRIHYDQSFAPRYLKDLCLPDGWPWKVSFQHRAMIVPGDNVMTPYLIMLTAQLGSAILAEASLSYLGLGTAEPTPSWGLMLLGSAPLYAEKAPWVAVFPGVAISLGVFGFNLFGDSLRDALARSCGGGELPRAGLRCPNHDRPSVSRRRAMPATCPSSPNGPKRWASSASRWASMSWTAKSTSATTETSSTSRM